jgi:hypothetical protein
MGVGAVDAVDPGRAGSLVCRRPADISRGPEHPVLLESRLWLVVRGSKPARQPALV